MTMRITSWDTGAQWRRVAASSNPQVKRIVQVDVGQQRTDAAALHRSQLTCAQPALFQHARVQPFLDQPHHARIGYPVLDEFDQPVVFDRV